MVRKLIVSLIVLFVGWLVYFGVNRYHDHRDGWRNWRRVRRACRGYRKIFQRQCKVRRALTCGKGWTSIAVFRKPTYLACRRALRSETLRKAKNTLNALHPLANAYKLYMTHIGKDRWTMKLPRKLRVLYQPYFRVPLSKIVVGTSDKLKMSAITDCYTIYFETGRGIFRQLRAEVFDDKETESFFLHELAHAEQCFKVGGRNNYARMWFRHLKKSMIFNILRGKKLNHINIHKLQPMEEWAERKGVWVQSQTNNYTQR